MTFNGCLDIACELTPTRFLKLTKNTLNLKKTCHQGRCSLKIVGPISFILLLFSEMRGSPDFQTNFRRPKGGFIIRELY